MVEECGVSGTGEGLELVGGMRTLSFSHGVRAGVGERNIGGTRKRRDKEDERQERQKNRQNVNQLGAGVREK